MDIAVRETAVAAGDALPVAVVGWVRQTSCPRAVFIARDESEMRGLAAALPVMLPDRKVLLLPAWDSLPYDRALPSSRVTGARVASLVWLVEQHDAPSVIVTTPEAILQRVPPPGRLVERAIVLTPGQVLEPDWLRATAGAFGYSFQPRVDEPGEVALRRGVIDIHPAGMAEPVRIDWTEGRIEALRRFDPVTQRSIGDVERLVLLPVSEAFTVPGEAVTEPEARVAHRLLPDGPLATLFDLMPDAAFGMMDDGRERIAAWLDLLEDAHNVAMAAVRTGAPPPVPPDRLYLRRPEIEAALCQAAPTIFTAETGAGEPPLNPAATARRAATLAAEGDAVVVCADAWPAAARRTLARRLRRDEDSIPLLEGWAAAERLEPGRIGVIELSLERGFRLPGRAVLVLALPARDAVDGSAVLERLASELRIGDLVVERERGIARLTGLTLETALGETADYPAAAGGAGECLSLAFLGGSSLLIPVTEMDRVWRYGASSTLSPDRLDAGAWQSRRAEIEREIEATAVALVERMAAQAATPAPVLKTSADYQRFVRRIPYALTADQMRAIRAVQQDMAAGHPMYRLVCGDVGFGKTEVALHAAAVAVFSGRQVAVAAPTTVLARQHLETFRRRFAGFGLTIEPLIRSAQSAAGKTVLQGVHEGRVDILVGTHAVAGARFHHLGLVVIDEEQRFGQAQKRRLRTLQAGVHSLLMTATPLPRSLQTALLGLIDASLLTTPPARRQPAQGVVVPFDPVVARGALLHEERRGGQSFVICPRIDDLGPMEVQLRALVPELSLVVAHGRMRGAALDDAMLGFANGAHDVLLATNIVEAGLDLPNANTMLIWRPDRFGLAQLHQLRGRVGRGRVQARVYLMTDPDRPPAASARRRLETICTLDSLGMGFAVSLADMDQRGAGDLLGEEQAGHLRVIGTELYRDVLTRAVRRARGETVHETWTPTLAVGVAALVPIDFVPEPEVRLEIYRRLSRLPDLAAVDEVAEELADRFGDLPAPVEDLLRLVRLRLLCRTLGIAAVHAGPTAVALTPRPEGEEALARLPGAQRSGERVMLPITEASASIRLRAVLRVLEDVGHHE